MIATQSSIVQDIMERSAEIGITAREDLYFSTLLLAFVLRDDLVLQLLISRAYGAKALDNRRAMLKILDKSWTPRKKLLILQILDAGTDHPLVERNHERDYTPTEDANWQSAVEVEYTIKKILSAERKLLEEELMKETKDLLQRIRSLSTVASPALKTGSDGMVEQ